MKDLRTIILAAGKGTRMKSDVPKVLHKICGNPIIQYVLNLVKAVGSHQAYVVLGHQNHVVREFLPKEFITVEQKKLLGTADAVKCVEEHLRTYSGDVLILCGDTPLLTKDTVKSLIKRHKRTKASCTFLSAVVHDPQGYGRVIRDQEGRAVAIREDKDAAGYERDIAEINAGVYCFRSKELFNMLRDVKKNKIKKEYYLTDVIGLMTESGLKVETVSTDDFTEALGVNSRVDLAQSESIIRKRILNGLMEGGVSIVDPNTTYVNADVKIGKDTVIHPFTVIESNVRIGHKCLIGPFARLREGTKIGNYVEVGNFTEVSRTKIGDNTLMKHFSFLGDSTLGANVNVGAGTITANFDGKDKHMTKVSDDAFIGSDCILVAPVKIGKGAVVGAGSVVVRKNVPDGAMAVGVPARIMRKGKSK